jgi:AcrR family transcriptional regulator
MSITERRERQRVERYDLIVAAACKLAEAEGWEAVTTRRLAALIDYSQPVLYSHFKGRTEIIGAVAVKGFAELADRLQTARASAEGTAQTLRKICAAYLEFAGARPVIYEAMFVLPTGLKFASEGTPSALRAAFAELVAALGPNHERPAITAEVLWSALHGLAVLGQSERIPMRDADLRLNVLVAAFAVAPCDDTNP